jgi:hypothetical protein
MAGAWSNAADPFERTGARQIERLGINPAAFRRLRIRSTAFSMAP